MKRRLLSAFLAVMMVLTMAPVAFAGNDETADSLSSSTGADSADSGSTSGGSGSGETATDVAMIGGTGYATLAAAVEVADGKTITLQKNVNEDVTIPEGKTITLDLNGKTLTNQTGHTITNNGILTITGSGTVDNVTHAKAAVYNAPGSVANLYGGKYTRSQEKGTFEPYSNGGNSFYVLQNQGTMTIGEDANSTVSVSANGGFSSLIADGYQDGSKKAANAADPMLTINGGNFSGGINTVKVDECGQAEINGGTFTNYVQHSLQNWNVCTVNGGAFTSTDRAAIYNGAYNSYSSGKLTVTGGMFSSQVDVIQTYKGTGTIAISGGTFSSDVSAYVAEGYVQNKNGSVEPLGESNAVAKIGNTYYRSLADAVAAATAGQTVTLLKDTEENVTIAEDKNITLELNGKTLEGGTVNSTPALKNNGIIIIQDSATGGVIKRNDNGAKGYYVIDNQGTMTIKSGYIKNKTGNMPDGSSLIRNAGLSKSATLNIEGGTLYQDGFIAVKNDDRGILNVSGGHIYTAGDTPTNVASAIQNWGTATITGGTIGNIWASTWSDNFESTMTIDGDVTMSGKFIVQQYSANKNIPTVVIKSGKFNAEWRIQPSGKLEISGGYFTSDPSAYKANDKYVVASDKDGYSYMISDTAPTKAEVIVNDTTAVTKPTNDNLTEDDKTAIQTKTNVDGVAEAVAGSKDAIVKAAKVDTSKVDASKLIEVKVAVDVAVDNVQKNAEGTAISTITFTATPTATVTVGGTEQPEKIHVTNDMLNGKPITVKLPLPTGFNPEQIKHISSDGSVEYFLKTAKRGAKQFTVDSDNCAVFEITHFSTFELSGTVTYVEPSSGGSSSGKTTYKVTTSAVNNGGVNASPSNAEKGATITITLSPDKGYKLDKLTVTDGSGKTVSTVKKSDTVYTFTMPASAVKVGVSYVKATETPSKTKFNDVSANDWFASAVDYVTGKGMMNGTADNTFSPKANTTRGMVVTVLYRLENQPSTSAASFTDVASGAYYANAVAWANANGIVSGYGSGKFGPNDKVTREQLAAILYRYAQYKKYDVSVGEDTNILSYDDAQSISSYAIPAIQWACGAGVVTGKSGSKLDPKGNATRAEVAAMLMRFCENVK